MRNVILLVALILVNAKLICGQEINYHKSNYHIIAVQCGINQIRETNLLPKIHSGFISSILYELRKANRNIGGFEFGLGLSRPKTNLEELSKSANINLNTAYSYCFRFIDKSGLTCFLGPRFNIFYSFSYYPNWDDSHKYWATTYSAGLKNIVSYVFKNNTRFYVSLAIPVISIYSRPDLVRLFKFDKSSLGGVFNDMNSNLKSGFWDRAFFLQFYAEYQFPILGGKLEAISYSLDYTRIQRLGGKPFAQLLHQIGLKILL
jgi:hypothetical protein